jgi:hypothetical protein
VAYEPVAFDFLSNAIKSASTPNARAASAITAIVCIGFWISAFASLTAFTGRYHSIYFPLARVGATMASEIPGMEYRPIPSESLAIAAPAVTGARSRIWRTL